MTITVRPGSTIMFTGNSIRVGCPPGVVDRYRAGAVDRCRARSYGLVRSTAGDPAGRSHGKLPAVLGVRARCLVHRQVPAELDMVRPPGCSCAAESNIRLEPNRAGSTAPTTARQPRGGGSGHVARPAGRPAAAPLLGSWPQWIKQTRTREGGQVRARAPPDRDQVRGQRHLSGYHHVASSARCSPARRLRTVTVLQRREG